MRLPALIGVLFALVGAAACGGPHNAVECGSALDCTREPGGECVTASTGNDWCAYPCECPSSLCFSDLAGDGLGNTCVPQQPADAGIDAGPTKALTVLVGGNGSGHVTSDPPGIDCPGTCTANFTQGSRVSLTATPSSSVFLGWSDSCSGNGTCQVTLDADKQVGALFGIPGSNIWLEQTNASISASIDSAKVLSGGDVVVGGTFSGTITLGGKSITASGGNDGFVARLRAADGMAVWIKQLGGASGAAVNGVDTDNNGDVFVAGFFAGSLNLGGSTFTSSGLDDVFTVKLKGSDGSHLWSKAFGGTSEDQPGGVAVDTQGNAVVAGSFYNSITPGTTAINSAGGSDIFIVKYAASNGAHVWSKGVGGTLNDQAEAVAIDGSDNVVIGGTFSGSVNFGSGNVTPPNGASSGAFVAKYAAANGAYLVVKPSNALSATSVAADTQGNMYVVGDFKGTLNVGGPSSLSSAGGKDIYVVKYSIAGSHVWSKSFGNANTDSIYSVRIDATGNLLLIGTFYGSVSYGGATLSAAGDKDIFVAHLQESGGAHLASMRLGGTGAEVAYSAAGAPNGDVFLGGDFTGFSEFGGQALTAPTGNTQYEGFALLVMPLD